MSIIIPRVACPIAMDGVEWKFEARRVHSGGTLYEHASYTKLVESCLFGLGICKETSVMFNVQNTETTVTCTIYAVYGATRSSLCRYDHTRESLSMDAEFLSTVETAAIAKLKSFFNEFLIKIDR